MRLCGEHVKLLGEGYLRTVGILRLSFAHHVDHLDAAQGSTRTASGLKPEHRPDSPFDRPMVLLNAIVEVGALPDANGFQTVTRSVLKPICSIAGPDRLTIRLAAVDHNPLGSAMTLESLAQKAFGSGEVSPLAEPELDRITIAIDRSV